MIALYGFIPVVNAASMESVKDTISDSEPSVGDVSHTIVFDMGDTNPLTAGEYVRLTFESVDLTSATTTCPTGTTASATLQQIDCVVDAGEFLDATSTQTIVVSTTTNPTIGEYDITVISYTSAGVQIERSDIKIYIIDTVTVSATVDANLTFEVNATSSGAVINGGTTDVTSTATTVPFGILVVDTQKIIGQQLKVITNAADGFTVTVQQDNNLESGGGADIDSFTTATTAPWAQPTPILGSESTYGYMGVASDDDSITQPPPDGNYQGLDGVTPLAVMHHDGSTLGTTLGAGLTHVAYSIEISSMQEAGDYTNTLTYICTPTY